MLSETPQAPADAEKFLPYLPQPETGRRQKPSAWRQRECRASREGVQEEHRGHPWYPDGWRDSPALPRMGTLDERYPSPALPLPGFEAFSTHIAAKHCLTLLYLFESALRI